MSYSIAQILNQVAERRLSLAAETAGSLLLVAAEQCADGRGAQSHSIWLESSGAVTVHEASGGPAATLSTLKGALQVAIEHATGSKRLAEGFRATDCAEFVSALRAALVPLNRPAARRSLIRLFRQLEALGIEPAEELSPSDAAPIVAAASELEAVPTPAAAASPGPAPQQVPEFDAPLAPEATMRVLVDPRPPAKPRASAAIIFPDFVWPDDSKVGGTPLLGTLHVSPHLFPRAQTVSLPAPSQDEWTRVWQPAPLGVAPAFPSGQASEAAPSEPFGVAPSELPADERTLQVTAPIDEQTRVEAAPIVERDPGIGHVAPKRSALDELVKGFRVSQGVSREVILSTLERSVASHGTPLPPAVRRKRSIAHSR
jgi:hypothetical protein